MIKYTYKKRQIIVPNGLGNFEGNCVSSGCDLQSKTVTQSTANAVYTPDDGYDGLSRITVNATQYGNSRFDAGVSSGVTYQKSLLSAITITQNGEYTSENGYSAVTVNVQGGSCNLQDKSVTQAGASATYTADDGYDGLSEITVDATQYGDTRYSSGYTDGYSSGNTDGYSSGYTSGYTDGYSSGSTDGYESGITYQKSLLSGITITENGTYTKDDGYSAVTVNIQAGSRVAYSLKVVATTNTSFSTYMGYDYKEMRINGVSMDFETFTGTTLTSRQTYDVYIVTTGGLDLDFGGYITEIIAVGEANSILYAVDTYDKFTGSSFKILGFPKTLSEISIVGDGLTSIEIPESVETIDGRAFYGSDNISTIYSHSKNLVMGRDQDVASTGTIHYPSGADYSNVLSVLGSGWTGIADL